MCQIKFKSVEERKHPVEVVRVGSEVIVWKPESIVLVYQFRMFFKQIGNARPLRAFAHFVKIGGL